MRFLYSTGYLLAGKLHLYDLHFDPRDLKNYIMLYRKEQGWLTRSEVAKELGVSLRYVSKLIKDGILPVDVSCGGAKYFFRITLEEPSRRIEHTMR
jgi:excisionase family DNA binding protein